MCDTVTVAPPRYAVFQIMGTRKIINNVDSMYEVLLPHVVGGSLKDAIAKTPEDMHGDFVSAQRSGTCYHRCILAATRYLLKRKGMQPLQQKQVFYALRVAYLDWTLDDLKRVEAIDDLRKGGTGRGKGGGDHRVPSPIPKVTTTGAVVVRPTDRLPLL